MWFIAKQKFICWDLENIYPISDDYEYCIIQANSKMEAEILAKESFNEIKDNIEKNNFIVNIVPTIIINESRMVRQGGDANSQLNEQTN